jgi:hypothetical protein
MQVKLSDGLKNSHPFPTAHIRMDYNITFKHLLATILATKSKAIFHKTLQCATKILVFPLYPTVLHCKKFEFQLTIFFNHNLRGILC